MPCRTYMPFRRAVHCLQGILKSHICGQFCWLLRTTAAGAQHMRMINVVSSVGFRFKFRQISHAARSTFVALSIGTAAVPAPVVAYTLFLLFARSLGTGKSLKDSYQWHRAWLYLFLANSSRCHRAGLGRSAAGCNQRTARQTLVKSAATPDSQFSTLNAHCSLLVARCSLLHTPLSTLHSQLGCSSSTLVARHFSYFYHSCHASLGSNKRQMQTECTRSCCCCKCCCALKRDLATVMPLKSWLSNSS